MTMKEAEVRCHSDLPLTKVWGFNGEFPGPTIIADKGKPVRITQINELPETGEKKGIPPRHPPPPRSPCRRQFRRPPDGQHSIRRRLACLRLPERTARLPHVVPRPHTRLHRREGAKGLAGLYVLQDKSTESEAPPPARRPRGAARHPGPQLRHARPVHVWAYRRCPPDGLPRLEHPRKWNRPSPSSKVESAKYRFRILNGSNARFYTLQLDNGQPIIQIGTDGGLLQRPISKTSIQIAPSERIDVVIDFSALNVGQKLILKNTYADATTAATQQIMRFDVVNEDCEK